MTAIVSEFLSSRKPNLNFIPKVHWTSSTITFHITNLIVALYFEVFFFFVFFLRHLFFQIEFKFASDNTDA